MVLEVDYRLPGSRKVLDRRKIIGRYRREERWYIERSIILWRIFSRINICTIERIHGELLDGAEQITDQVANTRCEFNPENRDISAETRFGDSC